VFSLFGLSRLRYKLQESKLCSLAEAAGVRGIRLENPADVEAGIAAVRMVLPIPPAITAEMARGFTLYMVKAVLDGRANDLVDLARSNLWA
jgi:pyruvate dehydrogenase (quinone)